MIVVATDAPLDARDLEAAGGARDVRAGAHRIDLLERQRRLRDRVLDARRRCASRQRTARSRGRSCRPTPCPALFEAALDATEEAIYNSLLKATDTTGNGRTIRALPVESLKGLLKKYGR